MYKHLQKYPIYIYIYIYKLYYIYNIILIFYIYVYIYIYIKPPFCLTFRLFLFSKVFQKHFCTSQ